MLVANYQRGDYSIGQLAVNTVFMQMLLQSLCERDLSQYVGYKIRISVSYQPITILIFTSFTLCIWPSTKNLLVKALWKINLAACEYLSGTALKCYTKSGLTG